MDGDDLISGFSKPRSQYWIQSLAKGLQVMRLFDETSPSLRLRDVSERTGFPPPTAFRIIATLEEEGFLDRTDDGRLYPGVAVLNLGSAALKGSSLVEASERPLRSLACSTGETVDLGVLLEDRVLYLARIRSDDLVTANIQVGSTMPAVLTSMGKLLLSYLPSDEVTRRIGADAFSTGFGPNAAISRAELEAQFAEIRGQAFSIQDPELGAGLRSVSVPVFGPGRAPVAAINISTSSARRDVASLSGPMLEQARAAAAEITVRLRAT